MDVLLIALITFFTGLGYLLLKHGMMTKVRFEPQEVAGMHFAYTLHIGDYTKSGKSMDKVYHTLREQGIETVTGFGLFYDNPGTTPKAELRSLAGCIVPDTVQYEAAEGVKKSILPATDALVATFPYKSSFSIAMGALKVYTALAKYRKMHAIPEVPVMEIYDLPNGQIIYVVLTAIDKSVLEDMAKAE